MSVGSVLNQGVAGMQASSSSLLQSAQHIARAPIVSSASASELPVASAVQNSLRQEPGLEESLINLQLQSQLFDANAKVVKAADETLGLLLDVRA